MSSTRKRLEALTADLIVPPPPSAPPHGAAREPDSTAASGAAETRFPPAMPGVPASRTGPGQMLAFRGHMLEAEGEASRLRERLAKYEGALPTRKLDPKTVVATRWANRHESSFKTASFARLKGDIEQAGGNVQPILVRPGDGPGQPDEVVFGHRRHRACLELNLPVLAVILPDRISDSELFAAMDRENRERSDLSPYEQGIMYQRALDEHLFPSQRRLAESLGVSHTWVRKAITVAQLPPAVIDCFGSPIDIQYRHAELLSEALEKDRRNILKRAEKARASKLGAAATVALLLGSKRDHRDLAAQEIKVDERVVGYWHQDAAGAMRIKFAAGAVAPDQIDSLLGAIRQSLQ